MLIDDLLHQVRKQITPHDLDAACRLLIRIGSNALLLAMVAGPGLLIATAVKEKNLEPVAMGVGMLFGLAALRYVAVRLSHACHSLVQSSPHRLSSTAMPDALAVCLLFFGLGAFGYSVFYGLQLESQIGAVIWIAVGTQVLAVGTYAACAALHPDWLNVDCSAEVRAGEEGIGILAFLLKLLLRFAPVQFGANAAMGALGLTAALGILIVRETERVAAYSIASAAGTFVLASALIPLASYLLMSLLSIFLDLAQSWLNPPSQSAASSRHAESLSPPA